MTTTATLIGASSACPKWDAIHWRSIRKHVLRLQMRIAKVAQYVDVPCYRVIMALVRLEPCDGKLSCTVLRGLGTGNRPWLLD